MSHTLNLYQPILHPPALQKRIQAQALSLLKPQYRVHLAYAAFILILLVMAGQHITQYRTTAAAFQAHTITLQEKNKKLAALKQLKKEAVNPMQLKIQVADLRKTLKEKQYLNQYLKESNQIFFSHILSEIAQSIPKTVWINRIDVQQHADWIKLEGATWHPTAIVRFIKKMGKTALFKDKIFDMIEIKNNTDNHYKIDFYVQTKTRHHATTTHRAGNRQG